MSDTKVTIKVEGLGIQELMLPRKDAITIYAEASKGMADRLLAMLNEPKPVPIKVVDHMAVYNGVRAIAKPMFEKEFTEKSDVVEEKEDTGLSDDAISSVRSHFKVNEVANGNPFTHDMFKFKKLVAYRCFECGKVTVRNLVLGESNLTYCHFCKEDVTIEKVTLAEIKCSSCDNKQFIYLANGLTETHCYKCDAPIDITYYKDGNKEIAKSSNLLRK